MPIPVPAWYRKCVTRALVVYWLVLFAATHVPRVPIPLRPGFSDKWQHYLAYAILGFLVTAWWSTRRRLTWKSAATLLAVVVAYGAFDELTQPLFGRDAELLDWRADTIGGATGIALYALAARVLQGERGASAS